MINFLSSSRDHTTVHTISGDTLVREQHAVTNQQSPKSTEIRVQAPAEEPLHRGAASIGAGTDS